MAAIEAASSAAAPTRDAAQDAKSSIARRSVSIFSRRGTEATESRPPFIVQGAMSYGSAWKSNASSAAPSRSQSVSRSVKSSKVHSAKSQRSARGTILNAVPPARTIQMTPLEEDMATLPNDEILSAISELSTSTTGLAGLSQPSSPSRPGSLVSKRSPSTKHHAQSTRRHETNTRIGVWVDGVVHWDHDKRPESRVWEKQIEEQTGLAPLPPVPVKDASTVRPHLSVIIPRTQPLLDSPTRQSYLYQPVPQRQVVPIAPAAVVSKFALPVDDATTTAVSTTTTTTTTGQAQGGADGDESKDDVSPVSSASRQSVTPPLPPRDPAHRAPSKAARIRASQASSSTEDSASDADDASDYSKHSSATSVETAGAGLLGVPNVHVRPMSAFSILSPGKAGVFDEPPSGAPGDTNKPLPPIPSAAARRSMTVAPLSSERLDSAAAHMRGTKSVKTLPDQARLSAKSVRVSRSMNQLDLCDEEFMRSSPYPLEAPVQASPTLSQAEQDLERHLSTLTKPDTSSERTVRRSTQLNPSSNSVRTSTSISTGISASTSRLLGSTDALGSKLSLAPVERSSSVHSVMHPPETAPTIPKRSRKREWRLPPRSKAVDDFHAPSRRRSELQLKVSEPILGLHRSASMQLAGPTKPADEPVTADYSLDDDTSSTDTDTDDANVNTTATTTTTTSTTTTTTTSSTAVPDISVQEAPSDDSTEEATVPSADEKVVAMSDAAEDVLLHILSSLENFEDLFNTATINKGMYRVFKENEMYLLRRVSFNQSPPAWELRKWSPPERFEIESSKASSQLEHTPLTYMRCHRRDLAVIESLKKLILENCQTSIRRETVFALSTPSHPHAQRFNDAFWRIWCFCKAFGSKKDREDDITGQLDWLKGGVLAHNQGCVATVNTNLDFDMSSVLLNAPDYFAVGNLGGLTSGQLFDMTEIWTCMVALLQGYQGRVDVARTNGIYDHCEDVDDIKLEEQILEEWTAYILTLGPAVVLEMAELSSEDSPAGFEHAKQNGWTKWAEPMYSGSRHNFLKEPVSRLYQERVAEEQNRVRDPHAQEKKELSRQRVANLAQEIRVRRQASSYKRLPLIDMAHERPMSMMSHASVRSTRSTVSNATIRPASPTSATPSARVISPIAEDRTEAAYNPAQYNSFSPGIAQDTSERAVHKIVDMGFTPSQAREALRATDRGNGLRVDKAVEFLLAHP